MEVCDQQEGNTNSSPRSDCGHIDSEVLEKMTHIEQHLLSKEVEKLNNKFQIEVATDCTKKLKAMDPWAIVDPQELATKAADVFVEQVDSKEWYMRLRALDRLLAVFNNYARVAALLDTEQIVARLIELLKKDAVMYVWARCILIMMKIAEYTPDRFSKFIPEVMPIVFDKHKEKKIALSCKLNEFCDTVVSITSLDCHVDAICGGLTHTSPRVKFETAMFLCRHLSPTVSAEFTRKILPCLIKCMHDADKNVREASYQAIASLFRCMCEPAAHILFCNVRLDKTKLTKINSYFEKLRNGKEKSKCESKDISNSELKSAKIEYGTGTNVGELQSAVYIRNSNYLGNK